MVNTFKSFVESPSKEPTSVLTKPDRDAGVEVYDDLSLEQEKTFKVGLSSSSSAPTLVRIEEVQVAAAKDSKKEGLQLKIVDLGNMKLKLLNS